MVSCQQCGNKTDNPKYCSSSCAAIFNNKKHPKRHPMGKCKNCNNPISTSRKYCADCRQVSKGLKKPKKKETICSVTWCHSKGIRVNDGERYCASCFYGPCMKCGKKSWRGDFGKGLCQTCFYGKCVQCGIRNGVSIANGESLCNKCLCGPCVKCGKDADHCTEKGSLCDRCFYGSCIECGAGGDLFRNDKGEARCFSCLHGLCVHCGKRSSRILESQPVCLRCVIGRCEKCGNKVPSMNKKLCVRCEYGICIAEGCLTPANGIARDKSGPVCFTHWKHGLDYVKGKSWHENTRYFYVIYWEFLNILKYGVGVSEDRHSTWIKGGGTLLRLFSLVEDETNGRILFDFESEMVKKARLEGYGKPDKKAVPDILAKKGTSNKECFIAVEDSDLHILSERLIDEVSIKYRIREIDF